MAEDFPTTNYSSGSIVRVGDRAAGATDTIGLVQFDLFADGLPRNALVTSADLRMYASLFGAGSSGANISIGLAGHGSGVVISEATWNVYSTGNSWSSRADMVSSPAALARALPETPAGFVTWTGFADHVNHARRNQSGICTFALDGGAELVDTDYVDFTDASHATNAPKLIIAYKIMPSFPLV